MYEYSILLVGKHCIAPLTSLPCRTFTADNAQQAFTLLKSRCMDVIVTDSHLPDLSIEQFIAQLKTSRHTPSVVVTTDSPNIDQAVSLIKAGASEYLPRPLDIGRLQELTNQLIQRTTDKSHIIAEASASKHLYQLAEQVAKSDATALITGESGTGKEILAGYIHRHSSRRAQTMVAINCAAIPEHLLESELFGYVKGAFTGAYTARPGKFEQANQSTLFLDEIGEMPLHLQAKLLRVLQQREVERIGSTQSIKLDIRIIAATNQNLDKRVKEGSFREDLFYRLNVFPLRCLPLNERPEDIVPLAQHFLTCADSDKTLSDEAARKLTLHSWPGNVRELENIIQRALIISRFPEIDVEDLMLEGSLEKTTMGFNTESLEEHCRKAEYQHIVAALQQYSGRREKTAQALGITTRTLRNKLAEMRHYGIDPSMPASLPQQF
ncbi:sigma-54-dependent transcriptional regulator [Sansalvadorimonas verongulae]|uniref:sigma-54-dependent transcriptional regulator n=1 Tax=Sansalvadorimonas verongulae TaxID=2172824 RepID=UPI0012BCD19A|nr:sigma-54 dependent transcriptional regulator [Sansalvadorimonas verongulae]MTI13483.1 sigma-54-dependent Fis family transcriptional regulator [Sansalvadorimonas verongulae]